MFNKILDLLKNRYHRLIDESNQYSVLDIIKSCILSYKNNHLIECVNKNVNETYRNYGINLIDELVFDFVNRHCQDIWSNGPVSGRIIRIDNHIVMVRPATPIYNDDCRQVLLIEIMGIPDKKISTATHTEFQFGTGFDSTKFYFELKTPFCKMLVQHWDAVDYLVPLIQNHCFEEVSFNISYKVKHAPMAPYGMIFDCINNPFENADLLKIIEEGLTTTLPAKHKKMLMTNGFILVQELLQSSLLPLDHLQQSSHDIELMFKAEVANQLMMAKAIFMEDVYFGCTVIIPTEKKNHVYLMSQPYIDGFNPRQKETVTD